ncbi:MAG: FMN-binding protein [Treponema sp.]|nr:FMN-binding protein [Treponema sp.]
MKNILKLGVTLALYATAACVGLAFVYTGTSSTISARQAADLQVALKDLFPEADRFQDITGSVISPDPTVSFQSQYTAWRDSTLNGMAIQVSGPSYGGDIKALVGIRADGVISRVKILEHADTPGLGANAASSSYYVDKANRITFTDQFMNKSIHDSFEVKQDVQVITAATVTSRAVSTLVKTTALAFQAWNNGEGAAQ